jgi:hypothetical protein
MIKTRTLLFSLALCCATAAQAPAAAFRSNATPRASIAYGTRCRIPRGAFIAVSENALRRLFQALHAGDHYALVGLIQRNEVEKLIRDASGTALGTRGNSGEMVEVQIPGFSGPVVTPRSSLITP